MAVGVSFSYFLLVYNGLIPMSNAAKLWSGHQMGQGASDGSVPARAQHPAGAVARADFAPDRQLCRRRSYRISADFLRGRNLQVPVEAVARAKTGPRQQVITPPELGPGPGL